MCKYFLVFIFLLSNNISAMEPIKINFENNNNNLKLSLTNVSEENILMNKRFSLGTSIELAEVDLIFVDNAGLEYPLCAMVTVGRLTEKDFVILKPGETISIEYQANLLISMYCLKAGQYRVKAKYKNRSLENKSVFNGSLESDWVTFGATGGGHN